MDGVLCYSRFQQRALHLKPKVTEEAAAPNARSRRERCATGVEIKRTHFFTLRARCLWVLCEGLGMPKRRRHAVVSAEDLLFICFEVIFERMVYAQCSTTDIFSLIGFVAAL
jgi:hypothetical protein